jgi:hypothetical protein
MFGRTKKRAFARIRAFETFGETHPTFFPILIAILVFIIYFSINIGITGPQYLSDEIGYLAKASTLTGNVVHASSSWNGGYSILISPAFLFFPNPYVEWQAVLIINALLWAGSALLLYYVLRSLYKKTRAPFIAFATLASFAYPAFGVMSGYAFATTGFVFIFMALLAALIKSQFKKPMWLVITALLSGYLFWIHPIGSIAVILIMALFIAKAIRDKAPLFSLYGFIPLVIAGIYEFIVKTAFDTVMSAGGTVNTHYETTLTTIVSSFTTAHFFLNALLLIVGLVLYICITTFGIAIYAAVPSIKKYFQDRTAWKSLLIDPAQAAIALIILSVIGAILATAISTAGTPQLRADQWIYGRYTEMFLLPLIGMGLLSLWRLRSGLILAAITLAGGILFKIFTNTTNTALSSINEVNIQAFWPLVFLRHSEANYFIWFSLGAIGISIVALLGTPKRKLGLLILLPLLALTVIVNMGWHRGLLSTYSAPSGLYQVVTNNYPAKTCIGYTIGFDTDERITLYSFYLHVYDLRPMNYGTWLHGNCSGPYLTYALPTNLSGVTVIGRETMSGLYMLVRSPSSQKLTLQNIPTTFVLASHS